MVESWYTRVSLEPVTTCLCAFDPSALLLWQELADANNMTDARIGYRLGLKIDINIDPLFIELRVILFIKIYCWGIPIQYLPHHSRISLFFGISNGMIQKILTKSFSTRAFRNYDLLQVQSSAFPGRIPYIIQGHPYDFTFIFTHKSPPDRIFAKS